MAFKEDHANAKIDPDKVFILALDAMAHLEASAIAKIKTASNCGTVFVALDAMAHPEAPAVAKIKTVSNYGTVFAARQRQASLPTWQTN